MGREYGITSERNSVKGELLMRTEVEISKQLGYQIAESDLITNFVHELTSIRRAYSLVNEEFHYQRQKTRSHRAGLANACDLQTLPALEKSWLGAIHDREVTDQFPGRAVLNLEGHRIALDLATETRRITVVRFLTHGSAVFRKLPSGNAEPTMSI